MPARKAAPPSRTRAGASGKGKPARQAATRPAAARTASGRFAAAPAAPTKPEKTGEFFRGARLMMPDDEPPPTTDEFAEITDPHKRLYLSALAATGRYTAAAHAAAVTPRTAYAWRQDQSDAAFQQAVEHAIKLSVERWEGELARRGFQGVEKPVYQQGRLVGTLRDYDTTAAIFMLKGALPEKYRDNVDHRVSGPGGGPIQHLHALADVPDDEIERRFLEARQVLGASRQLPAASAAPIDVAPTTPEASAYAAELAKRNGHGSNGSNGNG